MAARKKTATAETAEKPKRTRTRAKVKKPEKIDIENVNIDIDSYEWGEDCKLNEKQKLFVIWYVYPPMKHNAVQALIKAGYTKKSASVLCASVRNNPEIASYIKRFEDKFLKQSLDNFYYEALQGKMTRATFDVNDFHEVKAYTDKDGIEHEYLSIKDPSELTPEQRKCIDGIKINNNGTPSYEFADRTHETEFLIKLKREIDGAGKDDDSFQVETTAEIIKGNLQVKTKVIKANQETAELSELTTDSAKEREEED